MHANTVLGEAPATPAKSSGLAISSLICGIISCLGCLLLAGIPAIICGHMAKSRIKQSEGTISGNGMATAGLVLGYLSLVLTLVVALLAPVMIKKSGFIEMTKDIISLQTMVEPLNSYEAEFGKFPDSLDELQDTSSAKDDKWIYFPGQSSKSNGSNILVASPPYSNGVTLTLNVDGIVTPIPTEQYESATAEQLAPQQ